MLTLYHAPRTRSGSIQWLLEELGAPYKTQEVNLRRADGTGARDSNNPHPHGKVPGLDDDGQFIFEASAIAVYLTDKFPAGKMGPLPGAPQRGEYLSWLAYRSGVFEPAILCKRFEVKHVYGAMGWAPAEEVEQVLNEHLSKRRYFLGDEFSAVDIMVGGGIVFMMMNKMVKETPVFQEYASRLTSRPAFKKMMA